MDDIRKKARTDGYVETILGRRLYLPEIHSQNRIRQQAAERTAVNAPMQGSAADIIKLAMIHIDQWILEGNVDASMIMQVHDELVFEVVEDDVDKLITFISDAMCNVVTLDVPIQVGIGMGSNWNKAH